MARKPSRIAGRGSAIVISCTFAIVLLAVRGALAQGELRVTEPAGVIQNQFATGGAAVQEPVAPGAVVAERALQGPRLYRNPFSSTPTTPPLSVPLRPGSISRWQLSTGTTKQPAGTTNATLAASQNPLGPLPSADPIGRAAVEWDRLPPIEELRAMRKTRNQSASINVAKTQPAANPPDPIHFAPKNVVQPTWMVPEQPLATAVSAAMEPPAKSVSPAVMDPFEMPYEAPQAKAAVTTNPFATSVSEPAAFGPATSSLTLQPASDGSLFRPSPSTLPVIISDSVDTAEGWYEQAEDKARTASTSEDFTGIAELCLKGLKSSPTPDTAVGLRQLAAWAHNRNGELLADGAQPEQALAEFQAAIGLDGNCALAIHNRGVTLAQQGRPAEALRDFNRVIELNPGLAVAYRNRAELLTSVGRVEEAVRDYGKAIEQLGDDPELLRARAYALQRQGKFDEALEDLNNSLRLLPTDPLTFNQRGNLAAERGDFEQSMRDFEQAIELAPNLADAYRGLAWLLATCPDAQFRDGGRAVELAERAVKLSSPPDFFVLDALAAAHAAAGQFDQAVAAAQQALKAAPTDAAAPIRQRLSLYQQGKAFELKAQKGVRTVSHAATEPARTTNHK